LFFILFVLNLLIFFIYFVLNLETNLNHIYFDHKHGVSGFVLILDTNLNDLVRPPPPPPTPPHPIR